MLGFKKWGRRINWRSACGKGFFTPAASVQDDKKSES
jgi:hypothetical protein